MRVLAEGVNAVDAATVPRLHTVGDAVLGLSKEWTDVDRAYLSQAGYALQAGAGASLNGIARDPASGSLASVPSQPVEKWDWLRAARGNFSEKR